MKKLLYILLFVPFALFGQGNYSLSFDGVDNNVIISPSDVLNASITNEITLSSWVKIDGSNSFMYVLGYYPQGLLSPGGNPALGYSMIISDFKIYFVAGPGNVNDNQFENGSGNIGSTQLSLNEWYYISITYNQESIKFYINGILDFQKDIIANFDDYSSGNLFIGSNQYNHYFDGNIEAVEIWNVALNQEEIESYLICSPSGTEESLIGYWKFNEGSGNTVYDLSGNGNHGLINGATYSEEIPEQYCIEGCTDIASCNYDPNANIEDGSCTNPATYYNCDENCINDSDGDGICNELEILGCTDSFAYNFDINATENDGSCIYAIYGCTNINACNYVPDATDDDGSCTFALMYYNCDETCINDNDSDGVCDEIEVLGCTDSIASNFNPIATDDNGNCNYIIYGCTNENACNYNIDATSEDGSCIFSEIYYDCDSNCINDNDFDLICDEIDNCKEHSNPGQEDVDNDGVGDACDYDDGIGIDEMSEDTPKLIKMIDVLGREQKVHTKGSLLFYIYDNGKLEKMVIH